MTAKSDKNIAAGENGSGYAELFLVFDQSGRVAIAGKAPVAGQKLLARFSATASQVQVHVESADVPVLLNGAKLRKAVVLKNGDRLRAGDLVLNFAADGRGGILYQQAADENQTLPPDSNQAREEKSWLLVTSPEAGGDWDDVRLP